ncbi:hypothetical protein SAY87_008019 [Trapa incisa]|uniref:DUF7798 domain-containing protein n=1 Tax=Trapa incisa TaxID=236973 RepID=A0AAN7KHH4_9MYRT|nr:hypothetical protein SAY87_008019 [Trapa incisa]
MEDIKQPLKKDSEAGAKAEPKVETQPATSGGGWDGWGFSPLSILSDLQKVAEEISRNAAEVAKIAAKSISDIPDVDENSEPSKEEEGPEKSDSDDEKNNLRKSALDRGGRPLSGNQIVSQAPSLEWNPNSPSPVTTMGLKVLDSSVESFASGAWQALGSAWKGGTDFVHKLEDSAVNIASRLPTAASSVAPSLLETGKAFTAKGLQELEALSSHYALLFNRRKAKLSSEQKSLYDGKLKEVQKIFDMSSEIDLSSQESNKGKKIDNAADEEMKNLHDSSVKQAADMAAGFANGITGQAVSEIIQKTAGRLETLHSEGVRRLSEMCCLAVTQLLALGKATISSINKAKKRWRG